MIVIFQSVRIYRVFCVFQVWTDTLPETLNRVRYLTTTQINMKIGCLNQKRFISVVRFFGIIAKRENVKCNMHNIVS
jgi:hypothetical protein